MCSNPRYKMHIKSAYKLPYILYPNLAYIFVLCKSMLNAHCEFLKGTLNRVK